MYHQAKLLSVRNFINSAVAMTMCVSFCTVPALAVKHREVPPVLYHAPPAVDTSYPSLLRGKQLKHRPLNVVIYQQDTQPLGDRKPLLLVHGLRGEYRKGYRWDRLVKRFLGYPDFSRKYKVYLARYDSTSTLNKSVPQFQAAVSELHAKSGKQITLMALSLGGALINESMQDPEFDRKIELVLALAAPFHGSPLFCSDWFQYSLYKNLSYPWSRLDHSIAYRLYFDRNPNLLEDLRWDNCDSNIPEVGKFRSWLPFGPSGFLSVEDECNFKLSKMNATDHVDKSKFITYAGYLMNPYLMPTFRRQIETTILAPYTLITNMVPAHLAREHPVLAMLNREISRVLPGSNAPKVSNWPHVYGLNDGIAPVNSAIFLPDEVCKAYPLASEAELQKVRDKVDVRLARVFRNIDHLTFVDGYRPATGSRLVQDQLNPDHGHRTIFDWILSDLMQAHQPVEQLARESLTPPKQVHD
jgi:hypothetical protein